MKFIESDEIRNDFFIKLYDALIEVAYDIKTTAEKQLISSIVDCIDENIEVVKED